MEGAWQPGAAAGVGLSRWHAPAFDTVTGGALLHLPPAAPPGVASRVALSPRCRPPCTRTGRETAAPVAAGAGGLPCRSAGSGWVRVSGR